jgi:hypothetical protein
MKKRNTMLLWRGVLCLMLGAAFVSCEEYLDKSPDASLTLENGAFKDFFNFQGFVEEIYDRIPDKIQQNYNVTFNWGDDEIVNLEGNAMGLLGFKMDMGDYRAYMTEKASNSGLGNFLWNGGVGGGRGGNSDIWGSAWYCIRKANLGLENLDLMVGTDEERDLIAGQLYFFRAWWHMQMMMFWGGVPYVDQVLDGSQTLTLPRMSYQECADKAGEDFRKAADLLPINWDNTPSGMETSGKNDLRINKIMALGYLGKNYLWAASPLMENGAQLGAIASGKTYAYNTTYAQKAAEAFGELLSLVEGGATQYKLVPFDYSDVYNHTKTEGVTSSYSDLFYTRDQGQAMPGSTEAIFRGPADGNGDARYNYQTEFRPKGSGGVWNSYGDDIIFHPTANAVNMYGMANGLPLDDPASGFDPTHPFKNRDPRFYHDILFDGIKYINGSISRNPAGSNPENYRYMTTYSKTTTSDTPGLMRSNTVGTRTGYYIQKTVPKVLNSADVTGDAYGQFSFYMSYMRLADIYLMYAEACAAIGGASGKAGNFFMTAEDALNVIRERVGAGPVAATYTADKNKFMDEVRRERAVELMFEGHRWCDLQRWLLLTEKPYNEKYTQEFTRVEADSWFTSNDPANAQVGGWEEGYKVIVTRPLGVKHYWFPFPDSEVYLYPEFEQNPGW